MASRSSTPSEGEIIEAEEADKATQPPLSVNGRPVDRPSRKPERYTPPPHTSSKRSRSRSRSRSPYRSPRGPKRARGTLDQRDDRRNFRVHYEDRDRFSDGHNARHRSRERPTKLRDRRAATRSRSPPRFPKDKWEDRSRGSPRREYRPSHSGWERNRPSDRRREPNSREQSVGREDGASDSATTPSHPITAAPSSKGDASAKSEAAGRDGQKGTDTAATVQEQEPPEEQLDEATLIELRRKRREAIKAKYRSQASPMMMQALNINNQPSPVSSTPVTPATPDANGVPNSSSSQASIDSPRVGSPVPLEVSQDSDLANSNAPNGVQDDGPSAADYDPTVDMQEDKARQKTHEDSEMSAAAYDETRSDRQDVLVPESAPAKVEEDDGGFDMFAEQDDDMFAEESTATKSKASMAVPVPKSKALDMSMLDDVDDPEGYYKINLGELLDGRYQVQANLGRGMFSAVVRAIDQTTDRTVAIKIIRNNETMRKAAAKEMDILQTLNAADPDDRKHVIRLERSFEHKGHLCMVFENLSINLREVLKKFGRDVGINLTAVRAYAQQLFLGLSLLRKCNILHADLKPDNILVNEGRNVLKICDLGSAADAADASAEITPYLVSRFYRAPEIILGIPYDFAIDTWSAACTLFELYTGKILFAGRSNNQMLKAIMDCRGRFPAKALRKAQLAGLHFDDDGQFRSVERDKATGRDVVRVLNIAKPTRDLRQRLLGSASKSAPQGEDARELNLFVDLLDKCLALNPERRCSPIEALRHPFISRSKS